MEAIISALRKIKQNGELEDDCGELFSWDDSWRKLYLTRDLMVGKEPALWEYGSRVLQVEGTASVKDFSQNNGSSLAG